MDGRQIEARLSMKVDLIISAEIQHVDALRRGFGFVDDVATARMQAVAALAADSVIDRVFRHVIAIAPAAAKPVRKIINRAPASHLPAVPVSLPGAHYSLPGFSIGLIVSKSNLDLTGPPPRWPVSR